MPKVGRGIQQGCMTDNACDYTSGSIQYLHMIGVDNVRLPGVIMPKVGRGIQQGCMTDNACDSTLGSIQYQ
jgi:hypothetical protein